MENGYEYDYDADLAIDPHQLDEEWLAQPGKFMRYSELLADAERKVKHRIENMKLVRSQLTIDAKANNPKATVAEIDSIVQMNDEHKAAKEAVTQAEYEASILSNAVNAFVHRRKALENMVQLYMGNYFSAPREPRQISAGKRHFQEATRRQVETSGRIRAAGNKPSADQTSADQSDIEKPVRQRTPVRTRTRS